MKKFFATIVCFLLFATFVAFPWTATPKLADADDEGLTKNHAVATNDYAAIASGKKLYLFSETVGFWQEYEHEYSIGKLQIDDAGKLYFLDERDELLLLDVVNFYQNSEPVHTGISCMDFILLGGSVLYAKGQTSSTDYTQFFQTPVGDFSQGVLIYRLDDSLRALTVDGDAVYALGGGGRLYELAEDFTQIATLTGATEIAVTGELLFSLAESGLRAYSLTDLTAPVDERAGSFSALTAYQGVGYAVAEGKPYAYAPASGSLTVAGGIFALPSVHNIATGSIKTEVEAGNAEFAVVATTQSALLIEVDFLNATEILPYLGSVRGEPIVALRVWKNADHALLYYKNPTSGNYQTYLVNADQTQELTENVVAYQTPKTVYATNAVGRYAYPLLALSPLDELARGEALQVVGEINGLGVDYYAVQKGERVGYIPKSYAVAKLDGETSAQADVLGEPKNEDGVWRLVFLLLGAAAVGILLDFIILRNGQEE